MEEEVQSETYFPDFSDIYDESFQFWDFMNHKETSKKKPFDNETTYEDADMRSHPIGDHTSLLNREDDSHTFWDFLSSRTENTQHSPDSSQFSDIFSDRVEKKLKSTYGDRETPLKYTASDEFWDFLNSSIEDNKNCAAEVPFIPCGTTSTKEQFKPSSFLETSVVNHSILPRISSVYSLNTTSSVKAVPGIITPLTSIMNNSCESAEATHQLVVCNNASGDHKMLYAQRTDGGNSSQIPPKHNTNATHRVEACKNAMNDYEMKYYLTHNTDRGNSFNSSSHSTEAINQTVTQENSRSHYKLENNADTLELQDPISEKFLMIKDSPSKLSKSTSCQTLASVSCETQNLKLMKENILSTESMGVNNGIEPLYVLLPKSQSFQKPDYSQFLIIVNNSQPQIALNKNEAVKKVEQNITAQNFSSTESHSVSDTNGFQSDFRLAGFRNNHVLNACKRKRSFDSPISVPISSESNCSIPVSSTPLDIDTLNSISARVKIKQNKFSSTVKKQNLNQKPIKCIPLGRCKNAIQQTSSPISLETYEANAKNTLSKPCSPPLLRSDGESVRQADKTPPSLSKSQSNSFLTVTFPHIPNSNEKYIINYPVKQSIIPNARQSIVPIIPNAKQSIAPIIPNARQSIAPIIPNARQSIAPIISNARQSIAPIIPNARQTIAPIIPNARQTIAPLIPNAKQSIAPSSYQVTEIHNTLSSGIFQEPPSFSLSSKYKVVPKTKKCRRKTVKELLEERQSEIASLTKQRKVSKYCFGVTASEIGNKIHSETDCCDDPKNDHITIHREGEMSHRWPHEKSLRPRHYDMSELQIGFFKVQEDVDARGRFKSKFKVLFMKRQFLYDFPVSRCNQPSLKTRQQEWDDEMARIVVPFKTITSIHLKDRMIHLNVDSTPQLSRMNSQLSQLADNTTSWSHFLQSSSSHKVVLRKGQASKLKLILCQFDERFITLTDITSCENQFESPVSFKKHFSKNRKFVARRPPDNQNLILNQMCSCRTSCRSIRCSCVKAARSCSSTCQCTNCNNPLNVLETIGLDINISLKDNCLFQNIYRIPDLPNYLATEVRLDCCHCVARIQDCIPGTVLCPNTNCNAALQYSWCQKMVSYPERNPRNHCSLCAQCRFSNGRHCYECKKCYAVTSKSNECPTCSRENSTLVQLPRRNMFCSDKTSFKPQIVVLNASTLTKPPQEINKKKS